jgi:hypothetical protein
MAGHPRRVRFLAGLAAASPWGVRVGWAGTGHEPRYGGGGWAVCPLLSVRFSWSGVVGGSYSLAYKGGGGRAGGLLAAGELESSAVLVAEMSERDGIGAAAADPG